MNSGSRVAIVDDADVAFRALIRTVGEQSFRGFTSSPEMQLLR